MRLLPGNVPIAEITRAVDKRLRTTAITGFPGETYEEHQHLLNYIRSTDFDRLGVFQYVRESRKYSYAVQQLLFLSFSNLCLILRWLTDYVGTN